MGQAGEAITAGAAIALTELLDNCAEIGPGEEVVLLAHVDGLYGGDNSVDAEVIAWLQAAIAERGANPSVLWIDEHPVPHAWRIPPVFEAVMKACDVFINHSFDLTTEELGMSRMAVKHGTRLVRNFATTAALLDTAWAQTPCELVAEIRHEACLPFEEGKPFELTDANGTHVEGVIAGPDRPGYYTSWRKQGLTYRPFPEWVFPPINVRETSGIFIFDRMLSWWSRYIGIPPVFDQPIRLTIEKNRIEAIEGGQEARRLGQFLAGMKERIDDSVYQVPAIHSGVHPHADLAARRCTNPLYRRMLEHSSASNVHLHIGAPRTQKYPYWLHITADVRHTTWRVGDELIHDKGRMTALDSPRVAAVAARYPGRPGVSPEPWR